ncbi:PEBP family protein [Roseobacteraceae bacterium S113]
MRAVILGAAVAIAFDPLWAAAEPITVDVWADNWFSLSVNGALVLEDPVPITKERSFNKESAQFDVRLPAQVAFVAKDFKENDTGLEYIGTRKQQMGDGGLIAQFKDATGAIVGVTSRDMTCIVGHHAPVDASCAKERSPNEGVGACASRTRAVPEGWKLAGFDDSDWAPATEHSIREVRPKDGYDQVRWDRSARIVWTESLIQDNTIYCRMTLSR